MANDHAESLILNAPSCSCCDNCSTNTNIADKSQRFELIKFLIGVALFAIAVLLNLNIWLKAAFYISSYLLIGGGVLLRAGKNILRGRVFDENFLMSIATIGAFIIGQFPEGVSVMLFYRVGEYFQGLAVNRSRQSIAELMDLRPEYANVWNNDEMIQLSPEKVAIGQTIIVKPGEKIPLDGVVLDGNSQVDTAALTGESVPRLVQRGSEVYGGFVNKHGLLRIEVTKVFGESSASKILELVQSAGSKKAPAENFISKFARYYTPVVVLSASALALLPPLLIPEAEVSTWIYRALIFLVISCPCALVISIPLGYFGGIGGASRNGILVKGANYLDALKDVETVVFDKTGTLTIGVFEVININTQGSMSSSELLEYAACAESFSNHPIASSLQRAYGKEISKYEVEDYEEIAGMGVRARVRGKQVLAGNLKLIAAGNQEQSRIQEQGVYDQNAQVDKGEKPLSEPRGIGTIVHVAVDDKYAGYIVIADQLKQDAAAAIKGLKKLGIKKTVMLTGDSKANGTWMAEQLGIDEVFAELLPEQKVAKLEDLGRKKSPKGKLGYVGDGMNDAPVLARADIGIAMGALGCDAAIEAADVVIMTDEPSKIAEAIKLARFTNKIVWQNIFFALGVKLLIIILGVGGLATMWEAVFADVGVALIAVFNAMRVIRFRVH